MSAVERSTGKVGMSSGSGQPDDENRWNRHWRWHIASACVLAVLCWLQWNSPIVPLAGAYPNFMVVTQKHMDII